MILQLTIEPRTVAFKALKIGEIFKLKNEYFIKYATEGRMYKALNLSNFMGEPIAADAEVIPVNAVLSVHTP